MEDWEESNLWKMECLWQGQAHVSQLSHALVDSQNPLVWTLWDLTCH